MSEDFRIDAVLSALKSVPSRTDGAISLHEPKFNGNEWAYIKECLDTGWVSSVGKYVDRFEENLAAYAGVKKAVAVVNGTSALHVCLVLAGVSGGDEILIPAMTFIATANAITYCGAVPHFIDSEEKTLGVDPDKLSKYINKIAEKRADGCYNIQTGRRMKAVVPMHTFGHPVALDALNEVCMHYGIAMIEDAAESLGSYYKGRHTGQWGLLSAVSFNGNKIITTGGGGAVLTNDENLGKLAKHITTTAKVPHRWEFNHDRVGYNYRMPNINAALGCAQLEQLSTFLAAKRTLANRYRHLFENIAGITFFSEPEHCQSNYWLNALVLDERVQDRRDEVLKAVNDAGFLARPVWTLMHKLPMYADCPRMDLNVAESLARRIINIPSSAFLGEELTDA